MDQHKPTSIDRIQELGADKEAIQTFDLVKKQSELMQVKEKLGQRLSEIEEKLKTLEGDLRKINKDSCLREATTVYKDVTKTVDNLYQNLKKLQVINEKEITNKYSLKGDLEPKEANLQNLTQQLQEKRQKIEEPKKLASKLKNSGELIDQHLNRGPDQLPSLEEALQSLETTINDFYIK
jgi:DNA repair exonuclease SbcCD ATPase subunit